MNSQPIAFAFKYFLAPFDKQDGRLQMWPSSSSFDTDVKYLIWLRSENHQIKYRSLLC